MWFGCDVGQCSLREGGVMDLEAVKADAVSYTHLDVYKRQVQVFYCDFIHKKTIHSISSSYRAAQGAPAFPCDYALVNFFATKEDRALMPMTSTSSTTAVA